jgi:hypothetical protein
MKARTRKKKASKRKAKQAAPDRAGGPTPKRLQHIADDVLAQERRHRRLLDRQAERAAKTKSKPR